MITTFGAHSLKPTVSGEYEKANRTILTLLPATTKGTKMTEKMVQTYNDQFKMQACNRNRKLLP